MKLGMPEFEDFLEVGLDVQKWDSLLIGFFDHYYPG
jgi:hypothetical protein